jgi:CheY-like chemotaxis protein
VIDLNQIVNGMTSMLSRLIGEDIELAAPLDSELDSVLADPGQIEQILLNLVVNARYAMPAGGRLTIETGNVDLDDAYIEQHPEAGLGRHAMLAVTDTGTGMTPEIIAQVFEPFFTTKPVGSGTGLGLSTVYGIAKQSGGSVWIYSEPGKGTSFKVYLPAVQAPSSILELRTRTPALPPNGTETILLVEDEPALRGLTARMLATRGYSVIIAKSAHDALDSIEEHGEAIDLLLTDLVMPEMDGRELAERITRRAANVRVLFMSGYADQSVNRNGGLDQAPFLEKPYSAADLARKVRAVLDVPVDRPKIPEIVSA